MLDNGTIVKRDFDKRMDGNPVISPCQIALLVCAKGEETSMKMFEHSSSPE